MNLNIEFFKKNAGHAFFGLPACSFSFLVVFLLTSTSEQE